MPRRCTICDHPKRDAIDAAIVGGGASMRRIAADTGVTETTLRRHRAHLAKTIAKAKAAQLAKLEATAAVQAQAEVLRGDTLLGHLTDLQRRTTAILAKLERARRPDYPTTLRAIREVRENLALVGRLVGEIKDGPTVNVLVAPAWQAVRALVLAALARHPEARADVVKALLTAERTAMETDHAA